MIVLFETLPPIATLPFSREPEAAPRQRAAGLRKLTRRQRQGLGGSRAWLSPRFGQSLLLPAVIVAPDTSPPMATLPQSASIRFCGGLGFTSCVGKKIDKDRPKPAGENHKAAADPSKKRAVVLVAQESQNAGPHDTLLPGYKKQILLVAATPVQG